MRGDETVQTQGVNCYERHTRVPGVPSKTDEMKPKMICLSLETCTYDGWEALKRHVIQLCELVVCG